MRRREGFARAGCDRQGREVGLPCGTARHGNRGLIVGSPGAGKTNTAELLVHNALSCGAGAFVIDPKGSPGHRDRLALIAARHGRPFAAVQPGGAVTFDLLGRGGPDELADKVLAQTHWSEAHHHAVAKRQLQLVFMALRGAGLWPPSLSEVAALTAPKRLEAFVQQGPSRDAALTRRVSEIAASRQMRESLEGLAARVDKLVLSQLGAVTDRAAARLPDRPVVETGPILQAGGILYLGLHSDRFPDAARTLGTAAVQDLVHLAGEWRGNDRQAIVIVDELSEIRAENVLGLLERGRDAGITTYAVVQSYADLHAIDDDFPHRLLGACDIKIVHRTGDHQTAREMANELGRREHTSGHQGPWWRPRDPRPEPQVSDRILGELGTGWAAVRLEGERVRLVNIDRLPIPADAPAPPQHPLLAQGRLAAPLRAHTTHALPNQPTSHASNQSAPQPDPSHKALVAHLAAQLREGDGRARTAHPHEPNPPTGSAP